MGLKNFIKKILPSKKEPENKLSKDKKEKIISEVKDNEDGSKSIKLKRDGESDLSLNVNVSFLEKNDKVEDDSRVYDGSKNEYGRYSYTSVDSEGNKVTGSTSESPKEYALRKRISNTTVNYKGKEYGDKELKQIHSKLSENYVPVYQRQQETEKEFNPFKELNEVERQEVETWKKKMDASSWKSRQRSLRRQGKLKQYQVDMLNKLGMLWNPTTDLWEKNYSLFKQIGFCDELENWINEQRKLYSTNELSNENLYRLQSINFPFEKGENESFPFTWNSYYVLVEKLEKKRERIKKKENPISKREKKRIEKSRSKPDNVSRFYNMYYGVQYKYENKLLKLSKEELFNLINKINNGQSMYYDSYQELFKHVEEAKYFRGKMGNPMIQCKEDVKKFIENENIYRELKIFNNAKFSSEIREFACKTMLPYYKYLSGSSLKTFPPLQFLITYYNKEKKLKDLVELQKFANSYPLLKEIYLEKIHKSIQKVS
jgi:hypothetical protein